MTEGRDLKYATVRDAIADVERLRAGHRQTGNWTLPQASWHCGLPMQLCLKPVDPGASSTPEQAQLKADRLDKTLAGGSIPAGLPTPPGLDPVREAPGPLDDGQVTRLIDLLRQLDASTQPRIAFGPFGIVSADEFRRFILIHTAHHMRRFIPTT